MTRTLTRQWVANILWVVLTIRGMRLDWPTTKSPKQGNTIFENFDNFAKTKYFLKTIKTLKNLFVFDEQKLSMWKHI